MEITFLIIGIGLGYTYRTLRDLIKSLEDKLPKEEIGATHGVYGQTKGYPPQTGDVGLVETKTPQQLEWEESERLRAMQHDVRVKNGNDN